MGYNLNKSIAFFPLSSYDLGSSRIRVGNIVDVLRAKNINVHEYIPKNHFNYYTRYFNVLKHDILVFQKTNDLISFMSVLIAKILKKRIIFDIDDDYYNKFNFDLGLIRTSMSFLRIMVKAITFLADYVTVDSIRLGLVARKYNKNTILAPTNIKLCDYKQKKDYSTKENIVIGWMGSGIGHRKNLRLLINPLKKLSQQLPIEFKIVGAQKNKKLYDMFESIKGLKINFIDEIKWDSPIEISKQLLSFDIAVSPMEDTKYNSSRSQYKVITYLASGLPVVISPVGDGREIVQDDRNGFLASSKEDWVKKLQILIKSKKKREKF